MPSGWNQTGGYTGITLVLENLGVKMVGGGAMRSKPVFDARSYHPQRLEFLTRPYWAYWYGNNLSAAWGRYTGITLVLEKKWYTYAIHAIKANMSRKSWA